MNGKPDERLDQWVRQSLDRLPDAPPPGTPFDADRLWSQLRPELQKPVPHRWFGWGWWAAAACLIGVPLGWFWLNEQPDSMRRTMSSVKRSNVPLTVSPEQRATARTDHSESVPPTKIRRSFRPSVQHPKRVAKASPTALPTNEPAQPVATVTEPPILADTKSARTAQPESATTATVAAAPKRRFRVVHLNELQAEEQIRPTPYQTDRFVRLGTGEYGQPAPETAHTLIIWPLTNKSNQ